MKYSPNKRHIWLKVWKGLLRDYLFYSLLINISRNNIFLEYTRICMYLHGIILTGFNSYNIISYTWILFMCLIFFTRDIYLYSIYMYTFILSVPVHCFLRRPCVIAYRVSVTHNFFEFLFPTVYSVTCHYLLYLEVIFRFIKMSPQLSEVGRDGWYLLFSIFRYNIVRVWFPIEPNFYHRNNKH